VWKFQERNELGVDLSLKDLKGGWFSLNFNFSGTYWVNKRQLHNLASDAGLLQLVQVALSQSYWYSRAHGFANVFEYKRFTY
jgi:hypothetical protein